MQIEEMTVTECRAFLARSPLARLACVFQNQPYIVPVHVSFDGVSLYAYSTLGQKISWMRQNPLVCIQADEILTDTQWESVIALGTYEELPPVPVDTKERREVERLFQRRPMWWEPASVPLAGREQRARIVFRIRLRDLTGRRAKPDATDTPALGTLGSASDSSRPPSLLGTLRRAFRKT